MSEIAILGAARTPIGAFQGSLASLPAPTLGAAALTGAMERAGVEPAALQQVYLGCVLPAGIGQAPARQAALAAGCPVATGAITLNKVCGSAMRAMMMAANDLRCGDFDLVAAGGMENMSRAPYLAARVREGLRLGHGQLLDSMIHDGLWDPYDDQHMGNCAEICAREYDFSRESQDAYSIESYQRARRANEDGSVLGEIVPVEVPQRRGDPKVVDRDDEPFRVDLEKITGLRPAFEKEGTVTAGNASKINDGAAAVILSRVETAESLGIRPLATLAAHASHAQEPDHFTTAPIGVVRTLLDRAGISADEVDLWEVNEAFAVVSMAFIQDLDLDPAKVNVRGGAVALGHPIGASGARIVVTLLDAMRERNARTGCAAICIGGGEATAVLIRREADA